MSLTIHPIPAFSDNYLWIMHDEVHAVVVDPGDAKPVLDYLQQHQLKLTDVLITHHHYDHIDGVNALIEACDCQVYAPADERLNFNHLTVREGDVVSLESLQLNFEVLETPGHTLTHVCYVDHNKLFCGDTLFSGGCGRMFEGTPEMFVNSLNKISGLPGHIKVYCTHEYTLSNLRFARQAEPENTALKQHEQTVKQWRMAKRPSLPSSLSLELQINPFLRTHHPTVQKRVIQHWNQACDDPVSCFALLRKWKDNF